MSAEPIIRAERLVTTFRTTRALFDIRSFHAVNDVSLAILPREVVALVGESGSGKTTFGRSLLGLVRPSSGSVWYGGKDISRLDDAAMRPLRRRLQFMFQDPYASLDPRMTVGSIVGEGLRIHGVGTRAQRAERVANVLDEVGLAPEHANRFAHELSGGQRQRVGIARALALDPEFVVADEPVSSLDVSVQAQIIALLDGMRRRRSIAMLFVTHNLGVVRALSDRVAVMYLGRIVEIAPTDDLFDRPAHPYTRSLLASVPWPDPSRRMKAQPSLAEVPSALAPPSGCAYRTRCPYAVQACALVVPELVPLGANRSAACLRRDAIAADTTST